ncbi:hypothetical protein ACIBBE_24760 [Streptomyces sp. NPDC051644]|uniref:hypothetical protein n=1 Tax=Streptomyces sp. NPDC051644 TaxID=3365666 RepID=UPI0037AFC441
MKDEHATLPSPLAETALREVLALTGTKGTTLRQIREAVELTLMRIDVDRRRRRPYSRGPRFWLAKVTSSAFPRAFATEASAALRAADPGQLTEEDLLRQAAAEAQAQNHVCFTVEITDGPKVAAGRQVEVQLQDADAERLAHRILRLVEWRRASGHPEARRAPKPTTA